MHPPVWGKMRSTNDTRFPFMSSWHQQGTVTASAQEHMHMHKHAVVGPARWWPPGGQQDGGKSTLETYICSHLVPGLRVKSKHRYPQGWIDAHQAACLWKSTMESKPA